MRSLLIISIILAVFKEHIYNEAVHVRFTNVKCISDNKSVLIQTCRLKAIQRNKTIFIFTANLLHTMYDIKARVQFVKKANGYKPFLYDITFDVCEFHRKHNNPVISLIYNSFKDVSNLNHTCPYMGEVIVNNLYLRPEVFPLPLPSGEYGIVITWTFNKSGRVSSDFYFEFIEDF